MEKQTRLGLQSNDLGNDDEIQLSTEETAMGGNCSVDCQSSTIPANQVMNVEFKKTRRRYFAHQDFGYKVA